MSHQFDLLYNAIDARARDDAAMHALKDLVWCKRSHEPNIEKAWVLMDKVWAAEPKYHDDHAMIHQAFENWVRESLHQNVSALRNLHYMDLEQDLAWCIWQCVAEHGCF